MRYPDFPVLITQPMMPLIQEGIESQFPFARLNEQTDRAGFLAKDGARFKGVVTGQAAPSNDALFASLPNLKIVSSFGVGYDLVDAKAANARGIVVTNTPDVLTDEVADLAMGLLISTVRRLPQADQFLRKGLWLKSNFPLTDTIRGKTMGILGLGRIGKAIATRAEAFGLKIVYHGRSQQSDVPYPFYASLVDMAKAVDILMVIAPGGASTRRIVDRAVMEALGPKGTLINVARGTLVDEPVMVEMLTSGALGAAGLDVFEDEPKVPEALFALENVVLLPHVGSASVHTRNLMGQLVVDNVIALAEGRAPLTPVPETPWPL
ncbi:MAG: 2-hydroxyacid dehydrogenase [Beijerinckiaceae bacterium]|nr:2-hydroxyacid dehydrogenase [Beijerinckiaceae bacterium]